MRLLQVDSVEQAQEKLAGSVKKWQLEVEEIPFEQAAGRILAQDVFARENIPGFCRSTVDGYAVLAKDTAAAGESIPAFLRVIGQVEMGKPAKQILKSGECVEVPTGGMLPEGADAVVMVEYSEEFGEDGIALYQSIPSGANVVLPGEDLKKEERLLEKGNKISPSGIGALAAAGVVSVLVYKPLTITIISTGDELVPPGGVLMPGQVRDINTYALKALAEKNGFMVLETMVQRDHKEALEQAVASAMGKSDIVVVSGGSSQGKKDVTCEVIDGLSKPGVYTHGMAIKPGKPTILGYDETTKTLLAGLPGHPVSAMMVFELLFCTLYREMTGSKPPFGLAAKLGTNVASSPGKLTCWPVRLEAKEDGYLAHPVFGKSGLITTLTKADGYFMVDKNTEGLSAGHPVMVYLF